MINLTSATGLNEASNESTIVTQDEIVAFKKDFDDVFLIFNGILVSFMQAGFACLEAGAVRTKNVTGILMKNLCDMFISLIAYYLIGYAVAYGGGGNSFIGLTGWVDIGIPDSSKAHWFFQFIFSATAATILSGAVAERCHFATYIVYTFCISGFVYPVVSHWAWADDGWLNVFGYEDFAGSGAVHVLAGVCCFVGAAFLGPRKGRFVDGTIVEMPGHNLAYVGIGALILISGFLAFNAGSLGHISKPGDSDIVSITVINTIAGGSGALVVSLVLGHVISSVPWPFSPTLNAILAGMVSTCGGPESYAVWGAMASGCIGALAYFCLSKLLLYAKVDDPLEATAVHFGGGTVGVLMRPLISQGSGLVYGVSQESLTVKIPYLSLKILGIAYLYFYKWKHLYKNVVGLLAIIAWSAVCSCIIFGFMKMIKKLRVSSDDEIKGTDVGEHGEHCYPPQAWSIPVTPWNYDIVGLNGFDRHQKTSYGNDAYTPSHDRSETNLSQRL